MYRLLRLSAINDLKRFTPPAHYVAREYDPSADLELTDSVLARPASLGLTPHEMAAAHALDALAKFQNLSREIWEKTSPARDIGDHTPPPEITLDQQRQIDARCELYRQAALIYARTLGDVQLIEAYQQAGVTAGASVAVTPANSKPAKGHRDTIDPVIEQAQSKCKDPLDTAEVWAQMQVLAQEEKPPFQMSVTEGLKSLLSG